jgi:hypothetical protein
MAVSVCIQIFSGIGIVSAQEKDYDLTMQFTNLADPGNDHYEGWLVVDGSPVSTGKFTIESGNIVDLDGNDIDEFTVENIDIDVATDFVLSLEPEGDTDSLPAAIKPLAGPLNAGKDSATLAHNVGIDLSSVTGEYILATPTDDAQVDDYHLNLVFTNLSSLTSGHYEGWLIVSGAPISTGKFNISGTGEIVDHITGTPMTDPFTVMNLDIANVTDFVLSVEPDGDVDSIPGDIKPMAGAYDDVAMSGSISHNIGVDLSSVSGEYILATPTDDPAGNELSGIWFLNTTGPAAGLTIPDLTGTDWIYEGWAVISGTPVTTGRCNMSMGADDFDGYSETINPGPPFPGEDFLLNAPPGLTFPTDLSDQTIVISIEPRVDPDPLPFQFKPLVGTVPSSALDHTEYQMTDNTGALPTGTFTLSKVPSNENSGIWFLNRSTGSPVAGLNLPSLTGTDWTYEGWVVMDGTPVTTGTFDEVDEADGFDGYSSTGAAPPFPGEDFLTNAPTGLTFPTDLAGATTVISIEPRVDNDAAPFQFKPLVGAIPAAATDHIEYAMDDNTDTLPTGTASISPVEAEEDMMMTYLLVAGVIIIVLVIVAIAAMMRRKPSEPIEPIE